MALDMVARGDAEQASMITHRFELTDWREAIDTALNKHTTHASKVEFMFE